VSPKPDQRLAEVFSEAHRRLNGAAGLPFATPTPVKDEVTTTVPSPATPGETPASAGTPPAVVPRGDREEDG
jgi:hypothetical protein